uniref:Sema domain-containing protein n=1 Tax=Latimeria chalumnae TaxID=7897 RepID=H3A8K8_LATCH
MRAATLFFLLLLASFNVCQTQPNPTFTRPGTRFNHMVIHSPTGSVYIGAVNHLFHLSGSLSLVEETPTGPKWDSHECLPPVNPKDCPQSRQSNNTNMLLAVARNMAQLITCGNVWKGICEMRSLELVSKVSNQTKNPGDTQYVVANDPEVTTTGLVAMSKGKEVLFVSRGHASKDPMGIAPITTRTLQEPNVFSNEDMGKLVVVGSLLEYNHQFVKTFAHGKHIFFLFFRIDTMSKRDYKTYISRICADDRTYYSYVEVPLVCKQGNQNYNLARAAHLALSVPGGAGGARQEVEDLLFVTATVGQAYTPKPSEKAALCVYAMRDINQKIEETRKSCYANEGKSGETVEAYIGYQVQSKCNTLSPESCTIYPCGGEHTPNPVVGNIPVTIMPALTLDGQLTAVTAVVEANHTVAFLGDARGHLHKVYLMSPTNGKNYSLITVDWNSPVNPDLFLDATKDHLYVMTKSQSLSLQLYTSRHRIGTSIYFGHVNKYCLYAVLCRCSRISECEQHGEEHCWLWSYGPGVQCLTVESVTPPHQTREQQTQVVLRMDRLPTLAQGESFSCLFGDYLTPAVVEGTVVTCQSSPPEKIPVNDPGKDHLTTNLSLKFGSVTVASTVFIFYDCAAVMKLSLVSPCRDCVNSPWNCNWCLLENRCTYNSSSCQHKKTIYNKNPPPTISCSPQRDSEERDGNGAQNVEPAVDLKHILTTRNTVSEIGLISPPPKKEKQGTWGGRPEQEESQQRSVPTDHDIPASGCQSRLNPYNGPGTALVCGPAFTLTNLSNVPIIHMPSTSALMKLVSIPTTASPITSLLVPTPWDPAVTNHSGTLAPPDLSPALLSTWDVPPSSQSLPEDTWAVGELGNDAVLPSATAAPSQPGPDDKQHRSPLPDLFVSELAEWIESPGYEMLSEVLKGPDACPCMDEIYGSVLIPVGYDTKLTLIGRNLQLYKDQDPGYECIVEVEDPPLRLRAKLEETEQLDTHLILCQSHQYKYSLPELEHNVTVYVSRSPGYRIDSKAAINVSLYNCSVGHTDCSRCNASDAKYSCVWCGGERQSCVYKNTCTTQAEKCPRPIIHSIEPLTGPVEGGINLTISGSNLGQQFEDIADVTVAGIRCTLNPTSYDISIRIVCEVAAAHKEHSGKVKVVIRGQQAAVSTQNFTYQFCGFHLEDCPHRGGRGGGKRETVDYSMAMTVRVLGSHVKEPLFSVSRVNEEKIVCRTSPSKNQTEFCVRLTYGNANRTLKEPVYEYTKNPSITSATPEKSFYGGGRVITVKGKGFDVVQQPQIKVNVLELKSNRKKREGFKSVPRTQRSTEGTAQKDTGSLVETCTGNNSYVLMCPTPEVPRNVSRVELIFLLDNLHVNFSSVQRRGFQYVEDPVFLNVSRDSPYRVKSGELVEVKGKGLNQAMGKDEVKAWIGDGECVVQTLTDEHLYCTAPKTPQQTTSALPEFIVKMGKLKFSFGRVEYITEGQSGFPLAAKIGLCVGTAVVILIVLVIIFMYRRKSKQAVRDYKKVLVQLETLEISVGDQCRKEFSGTPPCDSVKRCYCPELLLFPSVLCHIRKKYNAVQDSRKNAMQNSRGVSLSVLKKKKNLDPLIHTLEEQQSFSQRDRGYVASLVSIALHGKLEYFTDIMKTLLGDLVEDYVVRNPKLMLRRTESVVEKLLSNWMSICLYSFLREEAGEPLYMLYRAIKYQVDKAPVDAVTGKAKRTINDSRLLRENIDYKALTLNVLMKSGGEVHPTPVRVLDVDTITQVKEKILDQSYKGALFSQRPLARNLDLEWRAGVAGHLTLSDEDVTSVTQGRWKRLNTLQHYKVGETETLLIDYYVTSYSFLKKKDVLLYTETPMLEDGEEGGVKRWHLVKPAEEHELPKHRRSSLRERERAKAIPEIYLTRLLSMKGTLQKFVDDVFQVIFSTNQPVPIAIKYFFDFMDEMAEKHGIEDEETVHIWKTNSLPLRFWVNVLKNPHFIFDVHLSDNVDAVLSVIAQTFIDCCTTSEHKVGRDSPVNKRICVYDIYTVRMKFTEEKKYYQDIQQMASISYQEMNSRLTEISGGIATEMNNLVALHELYKYINKYYDQIVFALEEDSTGQKMQLAYRLQQIAALVENKVTDL